MTYQEFCKKTSTLSKKDHEILVVSLRELAELSAKVEERMKANESDTLPVPLTYEELSRMELNARIVQQYTQPWRVGLDDHATGFARFEIER